MAGWLEHDYPDAARSMLEGLEECFTINRLDVPPCLHRCLATSNVVDNPHSGVRSRTRRVCRWRAGMPARWSAGAFLETEKSYRKIMGYRAGARYGRRVGVNKKRVRCLRRGFWLPERYTTGTDAVLGGWRRP
jgi:hypothetical protein